MQIEYEDIHAWIAYGEIMGWADKFCAIHEAPPMTDRECDEDESGDDLCIPALRIWFDQVI